MPQNLELQKEAVRVFGMDTQLLHATEELTELSLELQRAVRVHREAGSFDKDIYPILEEYCDARNALATVEFFLLRFVDAPRIEREQCRKNAKFAEIIQEQKERMSH